MVALLIPSLFILLELPSHAVSNANTMLADPARYFPGCTCQVAFLSFVVWMVALLIIAMFQYGERRKKRLTPVGFSIIAVILAFIIYSIPLWSMVWILRPSSFNVDAETGEYHYSKYGEKETGEMHMQGSYTAEELAGHIKNSRTYIVTTWAIISVLCVGALAAVPPFLKRQEKLREQAAAPKRKKRRSKGRVGTRIVKGKKDASDSGKDNKDRKK